MKKLFFKTTILMKILDRYLAKILLIYTLGVMIVWMGIYAFFNFINEIDLIGQHNYTLLSAVIYVASDLPAVVYSHSPVIILLGCLLALGHLAATSQLVVIQGCGISIMKIAKKVVITAMMFISMVVFLGEFIAPITAKHAEFYKAKALGQGVSKGNQQGFWLKDGDAIINVGKNLDDKTFGNVSLIHLHKVNQLKSIIYADKVGFDEGHLTFEDSKGHHFNHTEEITTIQAKNDEKYKIKVSFNQNLIKALEKDPRELSGWELYKYIDFLSENDLASDHFKIELYKRFIKPVTLVAMLLISMLFIFGSLRDASLGKKIFLGVAISLLFELSSRIGSVISLRFDYDPLLSASVPTIVVLAIGFILLKRKSAG
ncbi:permease YjgP/YjgQ family protein [uncultured Candidatus Thioglobus sp.]|nr:permease YjgP/YjgQ family protein [uncultured Candidatus Thioglobus sp.]